jgi:hypothetical protein
MEDLFSSKGMDLAGTTGTADLTLANRADTALGGVTVPAGNDVHLHGRSDGGGVVSLSADQVALQAGDNTVQATDVQTGRVQIGSAGDATRVQFSGFSIQQLRWDAKKQT